MTLSTCDFFQSSFFMRIFGNWRPATSKPYSPNLIHKALMPWRGDQLSTYWAIVVVVEFLCSCQFTCMLNLKVKSAASKTFLYSVSNSTFVLNWQKTSFEIYQGSLKLSLSWIGVIFLLGCFESFWVFEINHKNLSRHWLKTKSWMTSIFICSHFATSNSSQDQDLWPSNYVLTGVLHQKRR